jgi:hypothetical protein
VRNIYARNNHAGIFYEDELDRGEGLALSNLGEIVKSADSAVVRGAKKGGG